MSSVKLHVFNVRTVLHIQKKGDRDVFLTVVLWFFCSCFVVCKCMCVCLFYAVGRGFCMYFVRVCSKCLSPLFVCLFVFCFLLSGLCLFDVLFDFLPSTVFLFSFIFFLVMFTFSVSVCLGCFFFVFFSSLYRSLNILFCL